MYCSVVMIVEVLLQSIELCNSHILFCFSCRIAVDLVLVAVDIVM
jgi:hypothetical protein